MSKFILAWPLLDVKLDSGSENGLWTIVQLWDLKLPFKGSGILLGMLVLESCYRITPPTSHLPFVDLTMTPVPAVT